MCDKMSELDRRAVGGAFDMVYHVTRSTHFFLEADCYRMFIGCVIGR